MSNGVNINEKEFAAMDQSSQNLILFKNTEQIKIAMSEHINMFEQHLKDDKFNFKILRWMIFGLAVLAGLGKFLNVI